MASTVMESECAATDTTPSGATTAVTATYAVDMRARSSNMGQLSFHAGTSVCIVGSHLPRSLKARRSDLKHAKPKSMIAVTH